MEIHMHVAQCSRPMQIILIFNCDIFIVETKQMRNVQWKRTRTEYEPVLRRMRNDENNAKYNNISSEYSVL